MTDEKVYCSECRHYVESWCKSPDNVVYESNWFSRTRIKDQAWNLNKNNDCKWFYTKGTYDHIN